MNKIFTFLLFFVGFNAVQAQSLYHTDTIQKVSIEFAEENWEDILDSLTLRNGGYHIAKVTINKETFDSVGIRYRGTKSFQIGNKKNAYKIKLNYKIKDQNYGGYKVLKLSNALRDPSLVREVFGYEVARNFFEAPKANFLTLKINGESRGLYVNVEAIDQDKFLADNFNGYTDGALFEAGEKKFAPKNIKRCLKGSYGSLDFESSNECYKQNFHLESESGWSDLEELAKVLNKSPQKVESVLDVDRTLWMLAYNNVLVNLNSYSGRVSENYYLYKDSSGHFVPVINDLNLSFGSYKNTGIGSDLKLKKLQSLDPYLHEGTQSKPLIRNLLSNPVYKRIYKSHIREIVAAFKGEAYLKRIKELQTMIRSEVMKDKNWYYGFSDFSKSLDKTIGAKSKIPGITELMEKRVEFFKKHPDFESVPPKLDSVYFKKRERFGEYIETFRFKVKTKYYASKVKLYYRYEGDTAWESIYMKREKNTGGKGFYTYEIVPKEKDAVLEYYLRIENPTDFTFHPSNYLITQKSVKLDDLN